MEEKVKVAVRKQGDVAIVDMKGDVTSLADVPLNQAVESILNENIKKVIFNFTDVSYINSSGIAILIGIVTGFNTRGVSFKVYGLTPHFKKIFGMIGLTQYVAILKSEEEALKSFVP
jgi:anti-anti-sigma factor